MIKSDRVKAIVIYFVFIFYIILLAKILFLSRVSLSELFYSQRVVSRSINLVPFKSINEYIFGKTENLQQFSFANVFGNIILFAPLGVYVQLFKKDKRIIISMLIVFSASLLAEFVQGLFGIGAADVDDVILNCFGGLIGVLGCRLLSLVLREERKIWTAVAILSAAGLPVLLYYIFVIKMRF